MIVVDILLTLVIFLITVLGSSAFLSIAFVEGTANSRAGGAMVARRCFAVTITSSVFLFCIPMLNLLGVYSDGFAKTALSVTLSFTVAWNGVILPMLLCRLAFARLALSAPPQGVVVSVLRAICSKCCCFCCKCLSRFVSGREKNGAATGVGLVYWAMSICLVGGVWVSIIFLSSPAEFIRQLRAPPPPSSDTVAFDDEQQPGKHVPFACRFTSNDVHVLKRSGVLNGPISATGSKSASNSMPPVSPSEQKSGAETVGSSSSSSSSDGDNNDGDGNAGKQLRKKQSSSSAQQQQLPFSSTDTKIILRELQATACSGLRDSVLARIALLGACCVAALSGFAAVQAPMENLFPYLRRNSVDEAERLLQRLQQRLQQVMRRWGTVSQEGSRLTMQLQKEIVSSSVKMTAQHPSSSANQQQQQQQHQPQHPSSGAAAAPNSFFLKIGSMFSNAMSGGSGSNAAGGGQDGATRRVIERRLAEIQFEIAGYRYLASNLSVAIDQASATLDVAAMGKSRSGKLRAVFGIGLSVFGAAKAINLLLSVTVRRLSGEDAATVALRIMVETFGLQDWIDVQTVASRIALVLNMCLVSTAVRGFLILMFRLTQRKRGPPPSTAAASDGALPSSDSSGTIIAAQQEESDEKQLSEDDDDEETRRALLLFDEEELASRDNSGGMSSSSIRSKWWFALIFGGPAVDRCPGTISLVGFSLFMGLHFLGAFVLLRLGFPAKSRGIIIGAVGSVPFVPCHAVHDVSFLVSVVATAIVFKVLRGIDDADAAGEDDDDLFGV